MRQSSRVIGVVWLVLTIAMSSSLALACPGRASGWEPAAMEARLGPVTWVWYRKVALHFGSGNLTAWGSIDNGTLDDEVWMDRSLDGGATWQGKLGDTFVPGCPPQTTCGTVTPPQTFDDAGRAGLLRACGKAHDRVEIGCTPWVRAGDSIPLVPDTAAVDILMLGHNGDTQLWGPDGDEAQWLSANALTATVDYMIRTGDRRYQGVLGSIRARYPGGIPFQNGFFDDYAWWGLAWVRAYDLTGDPGYLALAQRVALLVSTAWRAETCGGGLRWKADSEDKNMITNALYLKLAATLHNHGLGGGSWLREARKVWTWLRSGGGRDLLGTSPGLTNDTLHVDQNGCVVSNFDHFTYNQGALIGGLAELYRATGEAEPLVWAYGVANVATTDSVMVSDSGVLHYDPEERTDGLRDVRLRIPDDGAAFKGVFVRNLRLLLDVGSGAGGPNTHWAGFLRRQTESIVADDRAGWAEFGFHWAGPIRLSFRASDAEGSYITFATQASAVDAFNASAGL